MSAAALLDRLERVRKVGAGRWIAQCPCHASTSKASLSVRELADGRVLVHDFGGCAVGDVLDAIGVDLAELFPDDGDRDARGRIGTYRDETNADGTFQRRRDTRQSRTTIEARHALAAIAADVTHAAVIVGDVADGRTSAEAARPELFTLAGRITSALALSGAADAG